MLANGWTLRIEDLVARPVFNRSAGVLLRRARDAEREVLVRGRIGLPAHGPMS